MVYPDLKTRVPKELLPGILARTFWGQEMLAAVVDLDPHTELPVHSHPHEQIGMVQSGKASFRIGYEERIIQTNDVYCVPSDVEHEATALGDEPFVTFETFYPVRDDFAAKLKQS